MQVVILDGFLLRYGITARLGSGARAPVVDVMAAEQSAELSSGPWNKLAAPFAARLCRESHLTGRSDPTLAAAAVDGLIIRGGCPVANAGFGAAPQGSRTRHSGEARRIARQRVAEQRVPAATESKPYGQLLRGYARSWRGVPRHASLETRPNCI